MAEIYSIPRPEAGEQVRLNIIRRPKSFGLWWGLHDSDGFVDGGCVSTHRTLKSAQAKSRRVADWLEKR